MSGFWSSRKAAVAAEAEAEQAAAEASAQAERDAALADKSDADLLEELGLPDPDQIEDSADIQQFLTEQIPARLKTRALRRLWRLNPVLANLDGLIDYGEDFSDSANVIENLQTAYQVGKGMTAHVEALAAQAEAEAHALDDADAQEDAPLVDNVASDQEPEMAHQPAEVVADVPDLPDQASDQSTDQALQQDNEPPAQPTRRRMRFVFDDDSKEMA